MDIQINKRLRKNIKELEQIWKSTHNNWKDFSIWDEKFTKPVTKYNKISIVTTVMNRVDNIKQTLLKNINDNKEYKNLEFVVLDYNSSDGLDKYIKDVVFNETDLVNYYRTTEPKFFDMSHSRNIGFKVASGDIVLNVDADNYTNSGFVEYINRMANEIPERVIFAKSRQLLRGRLGFYKKDFLYLGGYDERLVGYGHDDADLMHRALELGFILMAFRGNFSGCVSNHKKHQEGNYKNTWWITEAQNRLLSLANLMAKKFIANEGVHWGKANLVKNFKERISI